jgi:hypothetical protein
LNLEERIKNAIDTEAKKLIQRYQEYHNALHLEQARKSERIHDVPKKNVKTPEAWEAGRLHNPFYVRRRSRSISRAISRRIRDGTYNPNPPFIQEVPKPKGGTRKVSVYQVPDAAISRLFYSDLLAKNKHRFSSFSYAYRNDRNVHFAI